MAPSRFSCFGCFSPHRTEEISRHADPASSLISCIDSSLPHRTEETSRIADPASSLISCIDSSLPYLRTEIRHRASDDDYIPLLLELRIGLRNIKALLLLVRKLEDGDAESSPVSDHLVPTNIIQGIQTIRKQLDGSKSTWSRIQESALELQGIQTIRKEILELELELVRGVVGEVHCWAKKVDDYWSKHMSRSNALTADEVGGLADSILDNAADFLTWQQRYYLYGKSETVDLKVIDDFEVQITFLRSFLLFATETGVEPGELQDLLLRIHPFATTASRVFVQDQIQHHHEPYNQYDHVAQQVSQFKSKCSTLNRMFTDPQLFKAYTQALRSSQYAPNLHKDTLENFLDSLISLLWDMLRHSNPPRDTTKMLYERLRLCRAYLRNVGAERIGDEVRAVICDAGISICSLYQSEVQVLDMGLYALLERLELICSEVNNQLAIGNSPTIMETMPMGMRMPQVSDSIGNVSKVHKEMGASSHPESTPQAQIVDFQNAEVTSVLDQLTLGSKHLRIVPIIGMGGLGKTTFALELYNHPSVKHHFLVRAWCPISQVLDLKKVLLQLLNQIHPGQDCYSKMTDDDLADTFRKKLKGWRYLIFLDDVWTTEAWDRLEMSFPDDSEGSRIVLTSRQRNIAPHALLGDGKPYSLRLRDEDECFKILEAKIFPEIVLGSLTELVKQIARKCKGLPLTAVIVAGLMASTKQDDWRSILDDLSSGVVSSAEQLDKALELSYKNLPDHLQPCFLYSCAFPEDENVSVTRLIQYWMAEGFVRKQDVAREYLEKLVERSLVMVVQNISVGTGAKTCRIHDVLRDFGLEKAKKESFIHLLKGRDQLTDFNEEPCLQRLCIHSETIHFKRSKLFCPRARSLLFFCTQEPEWGDPLIDISFIFQIFKVLKVLDISHILMPGGLPNDIGHLAGLTYLSIQINNGDIPSSIGNLSNLETFICNAKVRVVTMPPTLWMLQKLKILLISGDSIFYLPACSGNHSILSELETLCCVEFCSDGSMETQVTKFPNIRRLKFYLRKSETEMDRGVVPVSLYLLHSLAVYGAYGLFPRCCEIGRIESLQKVTLRRLELRREDIAMIGKLPNLEVLKLEYTRHVDDTLEMAEGEFSKLRLLKLEGDGINRWIVSGEPLPCLQKLIFFYCRNLEEIPPWLETIEMLEDIQVIRCCWELQSLVRNIKEEMDGYGNQVNVRIV